MAASHPPAQPPPRPSRPRASCPLTPPPPPGWGGVGGSVHSCRGQGRLSSRAAWWAWMAADCCKSACIELPALAPAVSCAWRVCWARRVTPPDRGCQAPSPEPAACGRSNVITLHSHYWRPVSHSGQHRPWWRAAQVGAHFAAARQKCGLARWAAWAGPPPAARACHTEHIANRAYRLFCRRRRAVFGVRSRRLRRILGSGQARTLLPIQALQLLDVRCAIRQPWAKP